MTARNLYEYALIECNKENAPNILLDEFNYLVNKTINLYVNKRYNIYDINQLTTDDLRVLKSSTLIPITSNNRVTTMDYLTTSSGMATYAFNLPSDYLHMLNCICIYNVNKTIGCYNKGKNGFRAAATRLTADMYSQVLDNYWNKPSYKNPFYYIHNINTYSENPTNPINNDTGEGTDYNMSSREDKALEALINLMNEAYNQAIVNSYDTSNVPYNGLMGGEAPIISKEELARTVHFDSELNFTRISSIDSLTRYGGLSGQFRKSDVETVLNNEYILDTELTFYKIVDGEKVVTSEDDATSKEIVRKVIIPVISYKDENTVIIKAKLLGIITEKVNLTTGRKTFNTSINETTNAAELRRVISNAKQNIISNNLNNYNSSTGTTNNPKGDTIPLSNNVDVDSFNNNILDTSKSNMFGTISLGGETYSNRQRSGGIRYGNPSAVRCEIRYGTDYSIFELSGVLIDYIKTPQHIRLTQEQIDLTEDTSQILEFPDYVCQEIVNGLVNNIMERNSDPRIQTFPIVNLSIANPTQALAPETAGQSVRQ